MTPAKSAPAASGAIHHRKPARWWHAAALKTFGGIIVGFVVILTVMTIMLLAPGLKQTGIDAGIHIASHVRLAMTTKLSLHDKERAAGVGGYVFIDLDAGRSMHAMPGVSGATAACQRLRADGHPAEALNCQEGRETNRYLLAKALEHALASGARAVVIDVELSSRAPAGHPLEDAQLRKALASVRQVPVFYVLPTEVAPGSDTSISARLRQLEPAYAVADKVRGLPLMMSPGLPARSFPVCHAVVTGGRSGSELIPSLPWAMTAELGGAPPDCAGPAGDPSRIIYTLPSSDVDLEGTTIASLQPDLRALQIKLNTVYNRCLAQGLFTKGSPCASAELLRDRIVVIGSSAPYRGDWHYTPLGEMPGSLILINAIRSAIVFEASQPKHFVYALAYKLVVMLVCSIVWFCFWAQRSLRQGKAMSGHKQERPTLGTITRDVVAVVVTVALVFWISYAMSYSVSGPDYSLDALLPGLTVGLEVFVEGVSRLVKTLEHRLAAVTGWEVEE